MIQRLFSGSWTVWRTTQLTPDISLLLAFSIDIVLLGQVLLRLQDKEGHYFVFTTLSTQISILCDGIIKLGHSNRLCGRMIVETTSNWVTKRVNSSQRFNNPCDISTFNNKFRTRLGWIKPCEVYETSTWFFVVFINYLKWSYYWQIYCLTKQNRKPYHYKTFPAT